MGDKARVILAEDEILIAMEIEATLEDNDYEVCGTAVTAGDAVRLAERHKPDIALVDVNLANGTNGLDAVREIRSRFEIPAIIVSGHADEAAARHAGAVGWMAKPYRADDLMALMSYTLEVLGGSVPAGPVPKGFIETESQGFPRP